jgi:hypothetical protein
MRVDKILASQFLPYRNPPIPLAAAPPCKRRNSSSIKSRPKSRGQCMRACACPYAIMFPFRFHQRRTLFHRNCRYASLHHYTGQTLHTQKLYYLHHLGPGQHQHRPFPASRDSKGKASSPLFPPIPTGARVTKGTRADPSPVSNA